VKFAAAIPVLNEWKFLPAVAGQLLKVCDEVFVMRGTIPHSGNPDVKLTPVPKLDPRIHVVEYAWENEKAMRNAGQSLIADGGYDYGFSLDSDELFTTPMVQSIVDAVRKAHGEIETMACLLLTYWKSPDYRIDPPEQLIAPFLLRKDIRFTAGRMFSAKTTIIPKHIMHHLSYVRTDEEVLDKLKYFCHAHQVVDGWYENVWKAWDTNPNLENLHATDPECYRRAVRTSGDIRKILEEHGVSWP
jgi:hypothetical protein